MNLAHLMVLIMINLIQMNSPINGMYMKIETNNVGLNV